MLLCILLDTSAKLNQNTYLGQTLFDIEKTICFNLLNKAPKNTKIIIFTNRTKDCPKYLEIEGALKYISHLQALDVSNLPNLINNSINAIHSLYLSLGVDTFDKGRYYNLAQNTLFVLVTSYINISINFKITLDTSHDYIDSPIRWDEYFYSILLYFPLSKEEKKILSVNNNCELYNLCTSTGGSIYIIQSFKMIFDAIDAIYKKPIAPRVLFQTIEGFSNYFTLTYMKLINPVLKSDVHESVNSLYNNGDVINIPIPEDNEKRNVYPTFLITNTELLHGNTLQYYIDSLRDLSLPYCIFTLDETKGTLFQDIKSCLIYSKSILMGLYIDPKQFYLIPPCLDQLVDILSHKNIYTTKQSSLTSLLSSYLTSIPKEYFEVMSLYLKSKHYSFFCHKPVFKNIFVSLLQQCEYPRLPPSISLSKLYMNNLSTKKKRSLDTLHAPNFSLTEEDKLHSIPISKMSDYSTYHHNHQLRDAKSDTNEANREIASITYKIGKGKNGKRIHLDPVDDSYLRMSTDKDLLDNSSIKNESTILGNINDISSLYNIFTDISNQLLNNPFETDIINLLSKYSISDEEKRYLYVSITSQYQSFQIPI